MGTRVLFQIFGNEVSLFLGIILLYLLVTSIYREREFLADKKTSALMKDSTHLVSGLTSLEKMIPRGLHIEILSCHPSLQKRIDALKRKRAFSTILFFLGYVVVQLPREEKNSAIFLLLRLLLHT
ncbi:MAG: M48 family metalloprotease [Theionarchaea archaeon]|nr:M48 family metalloprotease [Theionarchaea archaeon]